MCSVHHCKVNRDVPLPGNPQTPESYTHTHIKHETLIVWLVWVPGPCIETYIWTIRNVSLIQLNLLFTRTGDPMAPGIDPDPHEVLHLIYQWSKCSSFSWVTSQKVQVQSGNMLTCAMVKTWFVHVRACSCGIVMHLMMETLIPGKSLASQAFCFTAASMLPSEEMKGKQRLNVCRHCQKPGTPRPQLLLGRWSLGIVYRTESWTMLSPEPCWGYLFPRW